MLKIKELLTKIIEVFAPSSVTLTGSYSLVAIAYRQCGAVTVRVYQSQISSLPKRQWTTLGTLPEKYRPIGQVDMLIPDNNTASTTKTAVWLRINTSGDIRLYAYGDNETNNQILSTATYLAATVGGGN